ncbi:MAG: carbohydrate ABC transporter permease [Oscillospiraceae bacterium]|nr:carbohydrate ABC transporter permease [Oscillospiraceae bacterium]MDY4190704.1 carbohydrate ABC transporter permease [Oscillospiraceae bacterium]
MKNTTWTAKLAHFFIWALLILLSISIIVPFYWMVVTGFKNNAELYNNSFGLPEVWQVKNYVTAWKVGVGRFLGNSLLVTVSSTVLTMAISSACAFGLSRFQFKGREALFILVLAGLLLAPQVAVVPLYRILSAFGIYNTYLAMIIPYVAFRIPFTVFLIRAYLLDFPKDIEEAAIIDGCSTFGIFIKITLPVSKPVLASAALLAVMNFWNEFMMAMIFTSDNNIRTIPLGLSTLKGTLSTDWGSLIAGLVIAAIPVVLLFVVFQKQFVRGMTAGGVKG